MPSRAVIDDFLAQPEVAVVGVSRDPKAFSRQVVDLLEAGGRTVHRVNRHGGGADEPEVFARLSDIPGHVDGVLVMVDASAAAGVAREAVEAGIPRVWLHRGSGAGAVSAEAVQVCRDAGVAVVDGACPFMFAGQASGRVRGVHRLHRAFAGRRFTS